MSQRGLRRAERPDILILYCDFIIIHQLSVRNQIELTLVRLSKIRDYPMIPDFGKKTALRKVLTFVLVSFWPEKHIHENEYGILRKETDRVRQPYSDKKVSQCHTVHRQYHTE